MTIQPTRRLDSIISRLEDLELNLPHGKVRDYVAESKAAAIAAFREAGKAQR